MQDEAFATAAETDKKAKKKNIECFNCKRKGHYQSECWAAQSSLLDPYELCMRLNVRMDALWEGLVYHVEESRVSRLQAFHTCEPRTLRGEKP